MSAEAQTPDHGQILIDQLELKLPDIMFVNGVSLMSSSGYVRMLLQ